MSLNYKELVIEEEEEVEGVFICLGDTLTLSSYDIPGLNYQWKKDNVILENEQNPDFTLWNIDTSDVGIYQISYFLEECRITTKTFDLHPIDCPLIPLNVHLQKWYLTDESQDVALSWFISNEEKVLSYQIFHSSNLQDWNALGIIYPDKRNLTIQNYQYLHRDVPSGYNYYKLKINHQDNTYTWSSIITFFKKAFSQEIVLFPNPSQNWIKISNLTHPCKIKIINSIGEILSEWTTSSEILEMDVQYLNNGFYILIAETPEISSTVNIPFIISK